MIWGFMLGLFVGYILGFHDRFWGRPPPPERGTYDSGDHDDRVDEYPDDWV